MGLIVTTWHWGTKYPSYYVDRLAAGVRKHLRAPHQFVVLHPDESDKELLRVPGCFVRLRMFDPAWQQKNGLQPGDRIINIDLDSVVTGSLDGPFQDRGESFKILAGVNSINPCPFNGSLMMIRAGMHPEVWSEFSLEKASLIPHHEFPDDQGWIHTLLPGAVTWRPGLIDGIYAFQKPGWPRSNQLPNRATLVVFPGYRDPKMYEHLPWVRDHWSHV